MNPVARSGGVLSFALCGFRQCLKFRRLPVFGTFVFVIVPLSLEFRNFMVLILDDDDTWPIVSMTHLDELLERMHRNLWLRRDAMAISNLADDIVERFPAAILKSFEVCSQAQGARRHEAIDSEHHIRDDNERYDVVHNSPSAPRIAWGSGVVKCFKLTSLHLNGINLIRTNINRKNNDI